MFFKISFVLGWCWSSWTFNKEGFQQKNIERSSRHFCWALNPHDVRFFATNGQMDTVSPQSWDCLLSLHRKCKDPQTPLNTSTRIYPLNRSMENQQSVYIITIHFKSFNQDLPGKKKQSALTVYRIFASQNSGSNETKPRWWGPRWDTSPTGFFFVPS